MRLKRIVAALAVWALVRCSQAAAQEYYPAAGPGAGMDAAGVTTEGMPGPTAGPDYIVRDLRAPAQPTALGCFYTRFEGIALKRERRDRVFLGEQDNVATGQVINEFTTKDVPFA